MSLVNTPLAFGSLTGVIYDFQKVGDVLPRHVHDDKTAHISIVTNGLLKAYGDGWEMTIKPGQVVDFTAYQAHEFKALQDNTRVINIAKGSV